VHAQTPQAYFDAYYDYWQRLIPDEDRGSFYNEATSREIRQFSPRDSFRAVFDRGDLPLRDVEDVVNASLYFELKTFLHGLFVVEDKVSMAHSLETRVPFIDDEVVDLALRIPPRYKLRELKTAPRVDEDDSGKLRRTVDGKIVLRRAMESIVPDEIGGRAKQGFSAPDASWFRGESIDYVNGLLREPNARIYEFLNPRYTTRMLDEHTTGTKNHRLLIWSLLSFEWWLRIFAG
jgi:asparagine synthase (glutamine-hydrolysing)